MNQQIKAKVAETAIRKMLKSERYFDICTVDKCLRMLNIPADPEIYDTLSPLHCVHWGEMDAELRDAVVAMLAALFSGQAMPVFVEVITDAQFGTKRLARH